MSSRRARAAKPRGPAVRLVRRALASAQRAVYANVFRTRSCGAPPPRPGRPFLVVANHASHLDMGLVKYAMGEAGRELGSMAAKDYFFSSRLGRLYFGAFTNLIAMSRGRGFAESVRAAGAAFEEGRSVMIFPEGGRTRDGAMHAFKPAAGFLALKNRVDILPVYIDGVYEAL
ncbi:MAG: 1-acyl-sn-glycerol-3-phosphate acyltransferase, partial [Elusimicrobia bacterium]|nr:1-acyl-sn-glycerol-3-phosphate acyltransferase [Elusimicrobiota bacterium]